MTAHRREARERPVVKEWANVCDRCGQSLHFGSDGNGRLIQWCACQNPSYVPVRLRRRFHRYAATVERLADLRTKVERAQDPTIHSAAERGKMNWMYRKGRAG